MANTERNKTARRIGFNPEDPADKRRFNEVYNRYQERLRSQQTKGAGRVPQRRVLEQINLDYQSLQTEGATGSNPLTKLNIPGLVSPPSGVSPLTPPPTTPQPPAPPVAKNPATNKVVVTPPRPTSSQREFIVYDFETTGFLNTDKNAEPIQISAAKYNEAGEQISTFDRYIRPSSPIPEHITTITRISDDVVKDAPRVGAVMDEFSQFVGPNPVMVGFNNAKFDNAFLQKFAPAIHDRASSFDLFAQINQTHGKDYREKYKDFSAVAGTPDMKLGTLARGMLGVDTSDAHNAAVDVELTAGVGAFHYGGPAAFANQVLGNAMPMTSNRRVTSAPPAGQGGSWDRNKFYADMSRYGLTEPLINNIIKNAVSTGAIDVTSDNQPKASSVVSYFENEFDIAGYVAHENAIQTANKKYDLDLVPISKAEWGRSPEHRRQALARQVNINDVPADKYGRRDYMGQPTPLVHRKSEHQFATPANIVFGSSPNFDIDHQGNVTIPSNDPAKAVKRTQENYIHPMITMYGDGLAPMRRTWLKAGRNSTKPERMQVMKTAFVLDGDVGVPGQGYYHEPAMAQGANRGKPRMLDLNTFTRDVTWDADKEAPALYEVGHQFDPGEGYRLSAKHTARNTGRESTYSIVGAVDFQETVDGIVRNGRRFSINERAEASRVPIEGKSGGSKVIYTGRDLSNVTDAEGNSLNLDILQSAKIEEGTIFQWLAGRSDQDIRDIAVIKANMEGFTPADEQEHEMFAHEISVAEAQLRNGSFREDIVTYTDAIRKFAEERNLVKEIRVPEIISADVLNDKSFNRDRLVGEPVLRDDGRYDAVVKHAALVDDAGHQLSRHHDIKELSVSERSMDFLYQHNPKLANQLEKKSTKKQYAYRELISADINSAPDMFAHEEIWELTTEGAMGMIDRAAIKVGSNASHQEMADAVMNEYYDSPASTGMLAIPTPSGDIAIPSGKNMRMLSAGGELEGEEVGAMQYHLSKVIAEHAYPSKDEARINKHADAYRAALGKTARGDNTTKKAAAVYLGKGEMSGWAIHGSTALNANEVYVPGREAGELVTMIREPVTGGKEFGPEIQGYNIGEAKAIELGMNKNRAYSSIFMQQLSEGDYDGDLVKIIASGKGEIVNGQLVDTKTKKVVSSVDHIKKLAQAGIDSGAANLFDEMSISKKWQSPSDVFGKFLDQVRNPTVLSKEEIHKEIAAANKKEEDIGVYYNTLNRKGVATAQPFAKDVMNTIGQRSYSLTSRPANMTAGTQKIFDLTTFNFETGGYYKRAAGEGDSLPASTLPALWHAAVEEMAGDSFNINGQSQYVYSSREVATAISPDKDRVDAIQGIIDEHRTDGKGLRFSDLDTIVSPDEAARNSSLGRLVIGGAMANTIAKEKYDKQNFINKGMSGETVDALYKHISAQKDSVVAVGKAKTREDNKNRIDAQERHRGDQRMYPFKDDAGREAMPGARKGPPARDNTGSSWVRKPDGKGWEYAGADASKPAKAQQRTYGYADGASIQYDADGNVVGVESASITAMPPAPPSGGGGDAGGGGGGGSNVTGGGGDDGDGRRRKNFEDVIKARARRPDVAKAELTLNKQAQYEGRIRAAVANGLPLSSSSIGKGAYEWLQAVSDISQSGKMWGAQWQAILDDDETLRDPGQRMLARRGRNALESLPVLNKGSWIHEMAGLNLDYGPGSTEYDIETGVLGTARKDAIAANKYRAGLRAAGSKHAAKTLGANSWTKSSTLFGDEDLNELIGLQGEYQTKKSEYLSLRTEHDEAMASGDHKSARKIEGSIQPLTDELKALRSRIAELTPTVTNHVDVLKESNKSLRAQLSEATSVFSTASSRVDRLRGEIAADFPRGGKDAALSDAETKRLSNLRSELAIAKRDKKVSGRAVSALSEELGAREQEVSELMPIGKTPAGMPSYSKAPKSIASQLFTPSRMFDSQSLFYNMQNMMQLNYMIGQPLEDKRQMYLRSKFIEAQANSALGAPSVGEDVKTYQADIAAKTNYEIAIGEAVNRLTPTAMMARYYNQDPESRAWLPGLVGGGGKAIQYGLVGLLGANMLGVNTKAIPGLLANGVKGIASEGLTGMGSGVLSAGGLIAGAGAVTGGISLGGSIYNAIKKDDWASAEETASLSTAVLYGKAALVGNELGLINDEDMVAHGQYAKAIGETDLGRRGRQYGALLGLGLTRGLQNAYGMSTGKSEEWFADGDEKQADFWSRFEEHGWLGALFGDGPEERRQKEKAQTSDAGIDDRLRYDKRLVDQYGSSRLGVPAISELEGAFGIATGGTITKEKLDANYRGSADTLVKIAGNFAEAGLDADQISKAFDAYISQAPQMFGFAPGGNKGLEAIEFLSNIDVTKLPQITSAISATSPQLQHAGFNDVSQIGQYAVQYDSIMQSNASAAQNYMAQLTMSNQYTWSSAAYASGLGGMATMSQEQPWAPKYQQELRDIEDERRQYDVSLKLGTQTSVTMPGGGVQTSWSGGQLEQQLQWQKESIDLENNFWDVRQQKRQDDFDLGQRQFALTKAQMEWQLDQADKQAELSKKNYQAQYEIQKKIFDLQGKYQREDFAIQEQRMEIQRDWQLQDFAKQGYRSETQFGWAAEDMEEAIRYSTGRDRIKLKRQQERMNVQQNWQRQDLSTAEDRATVKYNWDVKDLDLAKERFEEMRVLQEEQMRLSYEYWMQNSELGDESRAKQREFIQEQLDIMTLQNDNQVAYYARETEYIETKHAREVEINDIKVGWDEQALERARLIAEQDEIILGWQRETADASQKYAFYMARGYDEAVKSVPELGAMHQAAIGLADELARYSEEFKKIMDGTGGQDQTQGSPQTGPYEGVGAPADAGDIDKPALHANGGSVTTPTLAMLSEYGQEEYVVPSNGALVLRSGGNDAQMDMVVVLLTAIASSLTTGGSIVIDGDSLREAGFVHVEDFNSAY